MFRLVRLACGLSLVTVVALPACSGGDGKGDDTQASEFSSGLPRDKSYGSVTDADVGALCEAWAKYVIGPRRDTFCRSRVWSAAAAAVSDAGAMACGPVGGCIGAWDENGMAVGGPPPSGDVQCAEECVGSGGPACSYECSGSTQADLDASCAAAREAACGLTGADLQKACADAETKCVDQPVSLEQAVSFCDFRKPPGECTATVGEFEACVAEFFDIMEESYSGFSCSTLTTAEVEASAGRPPTTPVGEYTACKAFQTKCPGGFGESGVSPDCGNGVLDPGEQCDGANLQGQTCASVTGDSLPNGELTCNRACLFDGSACTAP